MSLSSSAARQSFLLSDTGSKVFFSLLGVVALIVVVGNMIIPEGSPFHVTTF